MLTLIMAYLGHLRRGRGGGQGGAAAPRQGRGAPAAHACAVDALAVKARMPAGTDGLALSRPTMPGTYALCCPPHDDRCGGRGMRGTPAVEP